MNHHANILARIAISSLACTVASSAAASSLLIEIEVNGVPATLSPAGTIVPGGRIAYSGTLTDPAWRCDLHALVSQGVSARLAGGLVFENASAAPMGVRVRLTHPIAHPLIGPTIPRLSGAGLLVGGPNGAMMSELGTADRIAGLADSTKLVGLLPAPFALPCGAYRVIGAGSATDIHPLVPAGPATYSDTALEYAFLLSPHSKATFDGVFQLDSPDLNGDGKVDGADIGIALMQFGQPGPLADLNFDLVVDGADLAIVLSAWGP